MGKDVPKANDEAFGIEAAERDTYWCNLAMVRVDHQGKGIAKAMFELAYTEVNVEFVRFRRSNTHTFNSNPGREGWRNGGPYDY